jgi:AcrR family transcriptional regulator
MATSSRRVGAETSKTRDTLLDWVEKLMLEEGYPSVTYRVVAAQAGVAPSLVQYYFPTLDDIFIAAIRRYSERNLAHLTNAFEDRADDPLRAVWEYSWDEATGAMMTEFMALGNHRKSIQAEIAAVTEAVRKVQLEALTLKFGEDARFMGDISLPGLQLLMSGIPKLLNLEEGIGVKSAHADLTEAFERYIDSLEPPPAAKKRKRAAGKSAAGKRRPTR